MANFYIVSGVWSEWESSTSCDVTCGYKDGVEFTRKCIAKIKDDCTGEPICVGSNKKIGRCFSRCCPSK